MPSIIPDPGSPPELEPIDTPLDGGGGFYTIDAGTQIYATTIDRIIDGWNVQVTNNGTVWLENNDITNIHTWFAPGGDADITNNGLIYLHGYMQTELSPRADYLVNTGSIYSVSDAGWARVISSDVLPVYVENSGLIAAQGLGLDPNYAGNATTIDSLGLLQLINHAGGQILAEAVNLAIGISAPSADVDNAGLIWANATGDDGLSVGISVWQSTSQPSNITNSGTIRADIAIYGAGASPFSVDHVENQSAGVIEGLVYLDLGDDTFVNNGTVIGDVDMGVGADTYSGAGSVSGVVDMGFGNDTYSGSGGADRAAGGRENDALSGNGGNDMLFGGFGDDNLNGNAGNDALAGEWGNDTIQTLGADYVEGGEDNDRVVLGDYSFEKVDGGTGFDTLAFATGARAFDLSTVLATGRVAGFEALELKGSQRLVVHQADVDSLTGGSELRIAGTATDTVNLVGTWVQGSNQTIDGALFETYTLNGRTVLVSDAATVTVGASAPAAGGLDAVASGDAAPHPGAADYTDPATYVNYFRIFSGDFTVDSREIFYSDTVAFISDVSEWTFTNNGQIYSLNDAYDYAGGLELKGRVSVINNGLIHVQALRPYDVIGFDFPSFGVFMSSPPSVISMDNQGEISVYSAPYSAIGVVGGGTFHNDGLIAAVSEHARALGVSDVYASDPTDEHQTFFNTGVIYAEGGGLANQAYFYGDYLLPTNYVAAGVAGRGSLTNDGDIIAVLGANADPDLDTVGVYLWKNYGNTTPNGVTNNGTIEGTIAIKFDNAPGDLSQIGHWVTNQGQIFGDIEFQDGNDNYDGTDGTMQGTVFGFGGNDTFLGGKLADSFYGGDGSDMLTGNGGDDFLEGGAGNDTLSGGAGFDIASYSEATAGVSVNLNKTGAQDTLGAGIDTLGGIEDLAGSEFNDLLYGNATGNYLFGLGGADKMYGYDGHDVLDAGDGDDYLYGLEGNDSLTGGAGYDRMYGGVGDDAYFVSDATDFAYELAGEGHDKVVASIDHQLRDHVEDLELGGSALIGKGNALDNGITGNGLNNRLYGYGGNDVLDGASGDDIIDGREGNDTLTGGVGHDKMYGGLGDDIFIVTDATDFAYENVGEGTDKVIASVTHALRDNIEQLELSGSADIRGYGNALNNLITGNSGANLLYGRDGHDTLRGDAGNDLLYGEAGNDRLDGGAGQDRYYGGAGADKFIFDDGDFAGPTPDRIMDFAQAEGDLIDLGAVDANSGLAGDQGFAFIGNGAFTGTAGQLRTFQAGGVTYLEGDTNGDGTADFLIRVDGLHTLQGGDFLI